MDLHSLQVALALASLACLGAAVWLAYRAWRARQVTGLPAGRIVYADTGAWEACEPFFSPRYRLAGKPDYVMRQGEALIPVEVKPRAHSRPPYLSDILQLAAYGLLIEDRQGRGPAHGLVRSGDMTYQIAYTPALRQALLDQMAQMRRDLHAADLSRNHDDPQRCRACGHREHCGQACA